MQQLTVNGETTQVLAASVEELLHELGLGDAFVAVALNHTCIRRQDFAKTPVKGGDDIEILAPMAGG